MAAAAYETVLEMAESLSIDERDRLMKDLSQLRVPVSSAEGEKRHSIMEFKGLGKDLWRSIDTDDYLRQERSSWDRDR